MDVFCYGSLIFPEVLRAVTGRDFTGERASLAGWSRRRLPGVAYPAVVAEAGATTEGVLWTGLDAAALAALDRFEIPLYERRTLVVRTRTGRELRAQVYVVPDERRSAVSDEPWDEAAFAARELPDFLRALRA